MTVSKGVKSAAVIAAVIVTIGVIIYFVIIFETYKRGTFIFKVVEPTPSPSLNVFYPTGPSIKLSQEEIDERETLINNLLSSSA